MNLFQIILLSVGALLFILMIIAYFTKKDYLKYSKLVSPILTTLVGVLNAVGGIFPNNKIINTITVVISAGVEAAGYAENLWLQGEIDKKLRPQYAQEYIKTLLEKSGIVITENIKTIINGVFAITCYLMPHYDTEKELGE